MALNKYKILHSYERELSNTNKETVEVDYSQKNAK